MKTRIRAVQIAIGLWAVLMIWSIVAFRITDATGDGFVRGMNKLTTFMIWQATAGVLAVFAWQVGKGLPADMRLRQYSRIPVAALALLGVMVLAVFAFAWLSK